MKRTCGLRALLLGMALAVVSFSSQSALAAGGHGSGGGGFHGGGGGGGFHGGGGGFHGGGGGGFHGGGGAYHGGGFGGGYHGGGFGGGYHGGAYHGGGNGAYHGGGYGGYHGTGYHGGNWGGYHGGYGGGYGYRGGYGYGGWGCCGWGWGGWGFGISLNFGWPYWGWGYGYPAYYAYYPPYPYYYYPPSYPYYYAPVDNSGGYGSAAVSDDPAAYNQANGYTNVTPYDQNGAYGNGQLGSYAAPQPGSTHQNPTPAVRPSAPTISNSLKLYNANYVTQPAGSSPARVASASPAMRPEVRNVIRAVQAMPPAAAQRAISSGRYGNLSPDELQAVKQAAGLPSE